MDAIERKDLLQHYCTMPAATALAAFQALTWATKRSEAPTPFAAKLVAALQERLGTSFSATQLASASLPREALSRLDATDAKMLLRLLIVGVLFDGKPEPEQLARLREAQAELGVEEPELGAVEAFAAGKRFRLRRMLLRKVWFAPKLAARAKKQGRLRTYAAFILATIFRIYTNRRIAARYATLRELPAGSLGQAFLSYLDDNKFPLPGTRGAVSDLIVFHDLCHVLSDYGTSPPEEPLVATFMAGFSRHEPFALILLAMLQFHLNVRVAPVAPGEHLLIDPAGALEALLRGAALREDIIGEWDYWPLLALPLEQVRADLALPARQIAAATPQTSA